MLFRSQRAGVEEQVGGQIGSFAEHGHHLVGRLVLAVVFLDVAPAARLQSVAEFERAVGFYATLVNINAYHQPGVEAGKKAAGTVLALQQKLVAHFAANPGKSFTVAEIAAAIGATGQEETLFKVGTHLAANVGRGVQKSAGAPAEVRFSAS